MSVVYSELTALFEFHKCEEKSILFALLPNQHITIQPLDCYFAYFSCVHHFFAYFLPSTYCRCLSLDLFFFSIFPPFSVLFSMYFLQMLLHFLLFLSSSTMSFHLPFFQPQFPTISIFGCFSIGFIFLSYSFYLKSNMFLFSFVFCLSFSYFYSS
jgi:hypothetical protein